MNEISHFCILKKALGFVSTSPSYLNYNFMINSLKICVNTKQNKFNKS